MRHRDRKDVSGTTVTLQTPTAAGEGFADNIYIVNTL
jgi:hypothetical protein